MKITIIGTGYVGLVSGVCLAAKGHDVTCVDIDLRVVEQLNAGIPHIHERGLEELLASVIKDKFFRATLDLDSALATSEAAIIAVGTPSENGAIDLSYVTGVARQIGQYLKNSEDYLSVIVKSTVVSGTTDTVVKNEIEAASGKKLGEFGLGMNPEFLREGEAINDFMHPDRIVLGHEDDRTLKVLEKIYAPWDVDKVRVNTRTAELIKYANNALLATQISAVNEIANLAAAIGNIDMMDVMAGVHLDKRWNPISHGKRVDPQILTYLVPGCGFGGSCFPKDVQALRTLGEQQEQPMPLLNSVLDINKDQPFQVAAILERETGGLKGRNCLLLGLAFKPDTDDVRESASLKIATSLLEKGACVIAHDPIAMENFKTAIGEDSKDIRFVDNWQQAVEKVEIIIVATRWSDYRPLAKLDLGGRILFDARRMFDVDSINGGTYLSIGRQMST